MSNVHKQPHACKTIEDIPKWLRVYFDRGMIPTAGQTDAGRDAVIDYYLKWKELGGKRKPAGN